MSRHTVLLILGLLMLAGCDTPTAELVEAPVTRLVEVTTEVEVTRLVEVTREVEVTRLIEVTQEVEVTREAPVTREVEVTRIIELVVTATPTPTLTSTLTPTPVPIAPTATPNPVRAHLFPETPIQPFDADLFIQYLSLVRDSFRSAADEFPRIFSGSKTGDCGSYNGWYALWMAEAPGFTDVPPTWGPLYIEYRSLIQQVVEVTWEIHTVCTSGGGTVSDETDTASQGFIDWAYPRMEQMVLEAKALPRR